jgi:acetyl-CoA acetyltransferase
VGAEGRLEVTDDIVIIGAGMHPWGKWGRNFVEYGVVAAHAALADAGVAWSEIEFVSGADTVRNGYPGYVAGATFAQALGWNGAQVASSYAACASGVTALATARAQILAGFCDVALVIGADTTPKGFLAPNKGERGDDPDWMRFRLLGATNPTYFGLYARRRMERFGATREDFAHVKVKNARHGLNNPYARYAKDVSVDDVLNAPLVAEPLGLLDICATSDGAAALVVCSQEYAQRKQSERAVRVRAISTVTPSYPQTTIELPNFATDSAAGIGGVPAHGFKESIAARAYDEAGLGPDDLDCAEVYDLSTAMELDWYEQIGLCEVGDAEKLLRAGDTTIGGRIPVNPSGGLACFGEAVPAQAIAQVCELTWQLRGEAGERQVEGARTGLSINQGLFGHGSAVIVTN